MNGPSVVVDTRGGVNGKHSAEAALLLGCAQGTQELPRFSSHGPARASSEDAVNDEVVFLHLFQGFGGVEHPRAFAALTGDKL